MVLVYLKNLLFPHPSSPSSNSNRIHIHHSSLPDAPLLPVHNNPDIDPASSYGSDEEHEPVGSQRYKPCTNEDFPPRRPSSKASDSGDSTLTATTSKPSSSFLNPRTVSDAIIGLSDGLTVPFALTAGLSAFNNTKVVLFGGFAELIAGSISMGLGGWLAGRGEEQFYNSTLTATKSLVQTSPSSLPPLISKIFSPYNLPSSSLAPITNSLQRNPSAAISFLMAFHHQLPPPTETKRTPLFSALTIAAGYFLGGFIPLLPYFFVAQTQVMKGLYWSIGVMAVCLFVFGVGRSVLVDECGRKGFLGRVRGGVEMVFVGGVAAGASWGIVKALGDGQ